MEVTREERQKIKDFDSKLDVKVMTDRYGRRKKIIRYCDSGLVAPIADCPDDRVDNRIIENLQKGDLHRQSVNEWVKQFEPPDYYGKELDEIEVERTDLQTWARGRVARMNQPRFYGGLGLNKRGSNV